jgi:hypothetical protein
MVGARLENIHEPISSRAVLCKHCNSEVQPLEIQMVEATDSASSKWLQFAGVSISFAGPLWIATYYLTSGQWPLGASAPINFANWNTIIGFGISMSGLLISMLAKTPATKQN